MLKADGSDNAEINDAAQWSSTVFLPLSKQEMDSQKSPSDRAPAHVGQSSADEDWMSWLPDHEVGYLGSGLYEAQDDAANAGKTSIHGIANTESHSNTSVTAVDDILNLYPDPLHLATDPWQR